MIWRFGHRVVRKDMYQLGSIYFERFAPSLLVGLLVLYLSTNMYRPRTEMIGELGEAFIKHGESTEKMSVLILSDILEVLFDIRDIAEGIDRRLGAKEIIKVVKKKK